MEKKMEKCYSGFRVSGKDNNMENYCFGFRACKWKRKRRMFVGSICRLLDGFVPCYLEAFFLYGACRQAEPAVKRPLVTSFTGLEADRKRGVKKERHFCTKNLTLLNTGSQMATILLV